AGHVGVALKNIARLRIAGQLRSKVRKIVGYLEDGRCASVGVRSVGEERRRDALLEQRPAHEEVKSQMRQDGFGEGVGIARVDRGIAISETAAAAPLTVSGLSDDLHTPETRV